MSKKPQLGKLPPKYKFFLNPYKDFRFSRCPQCDQKTKTQKHPFFIHIDPQQLFVLNMTGKYCPTCDLLILHQDKVEELLTAAMMGHNPDVIGNNYLVIGTVERKGWREAQKNPYGLKGIFRYLHDFKKYVTFEIAHYGWLPDDE
ncbi:MAG: hypothetical protein GY943_22055 [Chloroflexi bacterium]|nr:hypothetical protein [Chloroflexota bacterium]